MSIHVLREAFCIYFARLTGMRRAGGARRNTVLRIALVGVCVESGDSDWRALDAVFNELARAGDTDRTASFAPPPVVRAAAPNP